LPHRPEFPLELVDELRRGSACGAKRYEPLSTIDQIIEARLAVYCTFNTTVVVWVIFPEVPVIVTM
jgi:hypothetical protein